MTIFVSNANSQDDVELRPLSVNIDQNKEPLTEQRLSER